MSDIVNYAKKRTNMLLRRRVEIIMVRSKLAVICALGLICGCRYAHINQQKNESALQLMDIFDFRKEMRLAYIDMCKREAQRDHGDYKGWAWDCSRDYRGTYRIVHVDG